MDKNGNINCSYNSPWSLTTNSNKVMDGTNGDWKVCYHEIKTPSTWNIAALYFQINQSGTYDTAYDITNVSITDVTQSQLINQHMTFDSSGLRV